MGGSRDESVFAHRSSWKPEKTPRTSVPRWDGSRRQHSWAQVCSGSASPLLSCHLQTRWETHEDPCKRPVSRPRLDAGNSVMLRGGTAAAGVSLQMFAAVRDVSKGLPRVSESFLMLNFQENCALSRSNLPKCASLFSVLPCLHEGLSGQVVLARASQCHLRQKSFPQGLIQGARLAVTETQAACKADFGHRVRGT